MSPSGVKPSVLVVGGGVSGLSVGLALLKSGYGVTLLEQGELGAESSWAGGGILAPLLPWDYPDSFTRLALHSMAQYENWVNDIEALSGVCAELVRSGMHIRGLQQPESALAWCKKQRLAATLDASTVDESIWLPDVAQVRNPYLVAALHEAVLKLGGIIHTHCAAETATTQGNKVTSIDTQHGTFAADRFVLATGAWAGLGLPGLTGVPNVRPIRGQMLLFKLEAGALDTILYQDGLYLIPRRDGHILAGSTVEDVGFDKSTDGATRQRLHAQAAELLPALKPVQPIQHWAGLRPGAPDNIPIIDRHPDFDNLFVNAGHFRYGVTLAPASAELLLDLMEGRTPAIDPRPYSWDEALKRAWPAPRHG
ncbi:MAG TPA: glycine oxidase ThiO [Thiobacillus sp.]